MAKWKYKKLGCEGMLLSYDKMHWVRILYIYQYRKYQIECRNKQINIDLKMTSTTEWKVTIQVDFFSDPSSKVKNIK